jgi:hypothetical protein
VLATYRHIEAIPLDETQWSTDGVVVRGAAKLCATLRENLEDALLFKKVATVVRDVSDDVALGDVDDWEWRGPTREVASISREIDMPDLAERCDRLMLGR